MSQRQLASVVFTVLGVFIMAPHVPYIAAGAVYMLSSSASSEQGLAPPRSCAVSGVIAVPRSGTAPSTLSP